MSFIGRAFWTLVLLAVLAAIAAGVSWALASNAVNGVLGSPPPQMGKTKTTFLWDGMPKKAGHPRAWRFAFGPTRIPGTPNVVMYVSPTGKMLQTEPADLAARVKTMHGQGFH
jgi:hypothetical protein